MAIEFAVLATKAGPDFGSPGADVQGGTPPGRPN
jgi:hypothetical protein